MHKFLYFFNAVTISQYTFLVPFLDHLSLEREMALHLKTQISFTQRYSVPSVVEIGQEVSGEYETEKFTLTTDKFQLEKLTT